MISGDWRCRISERLSAQRDQDENETPPPYVFFLLGERITHATQIGVLREVLLRFTRVPGAVEAISNIEFDKRRIVAKNWQDLNPGRPDLAYDQSELLVGEWRFYKNVSGEHIALCLKEVCCTLGLKHGAEWRFVGNNWKKAPMSLDGFIESLEN